MECGTQSFPRLQKFLVKGCSILTIIIYLIIAALLVATAIVGAFEALKLLAVAIANPSQATLTAVLQSILLIIVIATLIDMVRSYVRVGRVLVRPILIAGVTTMVRRLLVADLEFLDIIGITIVILGLTIAMIYLGREDRTVTEFLRKGGSAEEHKEENKN
ncbi:MAG: phosphate-starvation-inducible PsiE family protein [Methanocorpusculum sp.]|nr:phosphate-starvation-inducible PsiE family protein [Methanocorpusculum sp.]